MKQAAFITEAELIEEGGSASTLETIYSIVTGNGTAAVACQGGKSGGGLVTPGPRSSLQAAIRYTGGAPVADIVNTASFDANGNFVPGVNISTDKVLVIWLHYPGDGDAANSWN